MVTLRPHIVWKIRGLPVAVVDAKYKSEKAAGYPNAGLYPSPRSAASLKPSPLLTCSRQPLGGRKAWGVAYNVIRAVGAD